MRTIQSRFSLVCLLVLIVLSGATHGIFFQGPKRAIWSLLESLGGHKKPPPPVHHYHMHYYPVPVPAPKPHHPHHIEIDLSSLHGGHDALRSYGGWPASHQEPEFVLPPSDSSPWASTALQPEVWPADDSFQQKSSWQWDNNELLEKDHAHTEAKSGLLVQVPLHQQIVLYQPPPKDKFSLLQTLLKKIRRINDAIFHPEEDEEHAHEAHDGQPHIHNTLTYASARR